MAVEDIPDGECLFEIPRGTLLGPQTSGIAKLLEKGENGMASSKLCLLALDLCENTTKTNLLQYMKFVMHNCLQVEEH